MLSIKRTDSSDMHFRELVAELDRELRIRDGDDHAFYAQFNKIDNLKHTVLAYADDEPVGCGAIKEYAETVMEVKRMFVKPGQRGMGIAAAVLHELETWCRELGVDKCILETGLKQPEAIALYKKSGYHIIPNYGQYADVENSVCFEKILH